MSEEESQQNAGKGYPDKTIIPALDAEHGRSNQIEERRATQENANNEHTNPSKPSIFQAFMHKHFPDAKSHDRWQLVFTFVIAVSTFFYTIFAGWTLYEIHSGGTDTHNIAEAAKSAAKTANDAMHISERAYLFIDHPVFNLGIKSVFLPITNSGRIPSGRVEITTHYLVANLNSQTQARIELKDSSEHRKVVLKYDMISTGTPITTNQTLNTIDEKRIIAGLQRIYVIGYITYNDGFQDTPTQKSTFCMDEGANRVRGDIEIVGCDFATYMPLIDPLPEH